MISAALVWGFVCIIVATLYIGAVTIFDWYSRFGDTVAAGIGIFGCLLIVLGLSPLVIRL